MRKMMTGVGLAAVLTFGPTAAAFAQTNDTAAQQAQTENEDDDSGKAGLAGLAGLLGLLGLLGLKRRDRRDVNYTDTPATTTTR